jgi:hypothetical protein
MAIPPKTALGLKVKKRAKQGFESRHAVICSITNQTFVLALIGENADETPRSVSQFIWGKNRQTILNIR